MARPPTNYIRLNKHLIKEIHARNLKKIKVKIRGNIILNNKHIDHIQ